VALTQEQRALLQLLLERDQSYEDISGLLGMDVGQVRRRARLSLIEIGGSDPDDQVALTDYLLGQADPIGRADVARHLRSDAEVNALARKLAAQLRLLAPEAEIPEIPAGDGGAAPSSPRPSTPARPRPIPAGTGPEPRPVRPRAEKPERSRGPSSLTSQQRTLIAALLGAGVLILVIVLLATGALGGDDGDSGGTDGNTAGQQTGDDSTNTGGGGAQLTRAVLLPPDGGDSPNGVAIFGRLRNTPVIQLTASDLEPPAEGENYSVWLYRNDNVALRLTQVDQVDESGRILIRFPIPAEALGFVANQTFKEIVLSLTDEDEYEAEVEAARTDDPQRLPRFTGEAVLQGDIVGPGAGAGTAGTTDEEG
jgi:hypothetical protein